MNVDEVKNRLKIHFEEVFHASLTAMETAGPPVHA
jgi:hypothetical protein